LKPFSAVRHAGSAQSPAAGAGRIHSNEPAFFQLAESIDHRCLQAPARFAGKAKLRAFGALGR